MSRLLIVMSLALGLLAFTGCGGDDGPPKPTPAEAKIIATVNEANRAFEAGDYDETCKHYAVDLVVNLINSTGAKNCIGAWTAIKKSLEQSEPDAAVRKAIMTFAPESAKVTGNVATATYPAPPEILKKALPKAKGKKIVLRKTTKGDWIIVELPQFG